MSKKHHRVEKRQPIEVAQNLVPEEEIVIMGPIEVIEEVAEEPIEEIEEVVEEIKPVYGCISNCAKLNIRVAPDKGSDVLCEAKVNTEVMIDLSRSTDDWYSVYLSGGIDGFCMKKFVVLN